MDMDYNSKICRKINSGWSFWVCYESNMVRRPPGICRQMRNVHVCLLTMILKNSSAKYVWTLTSLLDVSGFSWCVIQWAEGLMEPTNSSVSFPCLQIVLFWWRNTVACIVSWRNNNNNNNNNNKLVSVRKEIQFPFPSPCSFLCNKFSNTYDIRFTPQITGLAMGFSTGLFWPPSWENWVILHALMHLNLH